MSVLGLGHTGQGLLRGLLEDVLGVTGTVERVRTDRTIDIAVTEFGFGHVIEVGERSGALLKGAGLDPATNTVIGTGYKIIIGRGIVG